MTSRAVSIQELIADIDNLLANKGKRLSRILSNRGQEPRLVLEKVRDFLIQLQSSSDIGSSVDNQQATQLSPLLAKFVDGQHSTNELQQQLPQPQDSTIASSNAQQEISGVLAPIHAELQSLLTERANLVQEIRELEQRRLHNYSLAQQLATQEKMISEFLQVLMNRLAPSLTPEQTQSLIQAQTINAAILSNNQNIQSHATQTVAFGPGTDQVERLTSLARELDQRLLSLDGTVNVVFDSLQRNIHTYHESLSQALARMHSQGVQTEHLFASLINNLTLQLQQESLGLQPTRLSVDEVVEGQPVESTGQIPSKTPTKIPPSPSNTVQAEIQRDLENQAITSSNLSMDFDDLQETATPDLDAVLLSLGETPLSAPQSPSTTSNVVNPQSLQQDSFESIADEVDQLYASLFGTEVFTQEREDVTSSIPNKLTNTPTTKAADLLPLSPVVAQNIHFAGLNYEVTDTTTNKIETPPAANVTPLETTNTVTQEFSDGATPHTVSPSEAFDSPVSVEVINSPVDVPVNPIDYAPSDTAKIETQQNIAEDAVSNSPNTIPDPWFEDANSGLFDAPQFHALENQPISGEVLETKDISVNEVINYPSATDTIATLDDILLEVSGNELTLREEILQEASPSENLLPPEPPAATSVPSITLAPEQLRQLDQDLTAFDGDSDTLVTIARSENPVDLPVDSPDNLSTQNTHLFDLNNTFSLFPDTEKQGLATVGTQATPVDKSGDADSVTPGVNENRDSVWYLGIDLGTTGISAALLNRTNGQVYPIYWSQNSLNEPVSQKRTFRLPTEVYLPSTPSTLQDLENQEGEYESVTPAALAEETVPDNLAATISPPNSLPGRREQNLFSTWLKPCLQVALSYKNERQKWEPVLQLNEFSTAPLVWILRSLSQLFLTIKGDRLSTTVGFAAGVATLDASAFSSIINHLAGVICNCPSSWSEQYRFNVREALLMSGLVLHPQQVFFVEEAIASLLSELDGATGEQVTLVTRQGVARARTVEQNLVGNTLVINIGAGSTEMALVDLPQSMQELAHSDFLLHGFAYASKGIEQDIICQLLAPAKWRKSRSASDSRKHNNPWHWRPNILGLEQMRWHSLGLEELELPRSGEPDLSDRIRLGQRLSSSVLGQAVLDAAIAVKLVLQHQDTFTLELADQSWELHRRDLESQVFVPFVRRLNRELNRLLVAKGIPTEAINQAILTGGVGTLGAVGRWLRQKLPNARIVQDLYLGENGSPTCSRVCLGLAMLPLHPLVLEIPRQQYTDYFLFTELLRLLPERSVSFGEVIQLFEGRGINTRTCQQRLLAFLEGEIPAGFVPNSIDSTWLTQSSKENPDYKAIASAPLFEKQGSLTYRPNPQQLKSLRRYLDALKTSTLQSLEEPYTVNFVLGVVS